ncbi:TPA: hypothetical protein N0F65_005523 [Lagenidium giganteum]|uniref:protein O-GlcNAc transferase n=1 Tax=Lagenidium giganteum TaxID=4803 RepID=A0AAV2YIQ5_9STRA|nr:TPA: hypothetical protein N0F65_005523 [Lagenidium giganteum]
MVAAAVLVVVAAVLVVVAVAVGAGDYSGWDVTRVREHLRALYANGEIVELEAAAREIIRTNPHVQRDLSSPSVYQYLGVAQFSLGKLEEATTAFEQAVRLNDDDVQSWVHLGNCYLYQMKLAKATTALEVAVLHKGAAHESHRLFKARNWMADWQDREELLDVSLEHLRREIADHKPTDVNALDFVELLAPLAHRLNGNLRIGFVSSDFGVHPVATLIRGLVSLLSSQRNNAIVYCFSLTPATSWWKRNISRSVDHMVSLSGKNPIEAARVIKSHRIDVLVDLNGYTLHSGLPVLAHRPSPVQISYLGFPMTTGAPFIDYFISDPISSPADISPSSFTEKLLLLPSHYIVNDHLQMLGHTIEGPRPTFADATGDRRDETPFVFATFSNWQKMDPVQFGAWMEILLRVPDSVMWFLRYSGHEEAEIHLKDEAKAHGVDGENRLIFSKLSPWINHTLPKRMADIVLDTALKNGHTTMIDALWAGVPLITLEGTHMSNRAGSSALHSLGLGNIVVNSMKDYVDVTVHLATNLPLLAQLRRDVEDRRSRFPLFDTSGYTGRFASAMQSAWEVKKLQASQVGKTNKSMQLFFETNLGQPRHNPTQLSPLSALGDNHVVDEFEVLVQSAIDAKNPMRLHIGGHTRREGWWVVDIDESNQVADFVLAMDNLYPFPDRSVEAIYASHVLEHCHYGLGGEVKDTLREWHRVLKPGGNLYVAVPDLFTLSSLFVSKRSSNQERFSIMRMMFGGQTNPFDVHKVGFDFPILAQYLENAGFCDVQQVDDFRLFQDTSVMKFKNKPISLNVKASACASR